MTHFGSICGQLSIQWEPVWAQGSDVGSGLDGMG